MKKLLIIFGILILLGIFWLSRYEIRTTQYTAYKLDRWTGKVTFLIHQVEKPVKFEKPHLKEVTDPKTLKDLPSDKKKDIFDRIDDETKK